MQIFVPFASPLETAKCLDPKRLNRQIQEAKVILDAINGTGKGWFNHPIVKMYKEHSEWLENYLNCLAYYRDYNKSDDSVIMNRFLSCAIMYSHCDESLTPPFLTEEFCNQHKRRLYTKDKEHYKQFAKYGESEENWYCIGNKIVKYINGKRIE